MTWTLVALLGYFFAALCSVFDKYLLSDRIPVPAVYAFFVSLFSLIPMVLIPFGFEYSNWYATWTLLLSGVLFVYGLVALYTAVKEHEISRVAPLVGTATSLVAFLAVFFSFSADEPVNILYIGALALLIIGGLLISFDLPLHKGEHISKFVLLSGLLTGASLLLLKEGYGTSNFVSGIVWSRLGMFLGGLSLLTVPSFRHAISAQFHGFGHRSERALGTTVLFVLNKTSAGIATFLIAYAIKIGPLSFVQALSGMQYVFLLLMTLPLSLRYPDIFGERLHFWDWFQKIAAVVIISAGLWLAAINGVPLLLG